MGDRVARFLAACGVDARERLPRSSPAEAHVGEFGEVLVRVRIDKIGARCEVESAGPTCTTLSGRRPAVDDAPVSA